MEQEAKRKAQALRELRVKMKSPVLREQKAKKKDAVAWREQLKKNNILQQVRYCSRMSWEDHQVPLRASSADWSELMMVFG